MKSKLKKVLNRAKKSGSESSPADANAPRITNETVASHREEVLSSARKYVYPLQHSKHKIVIISMTLFITAIVAFFTVCTLALYKFNSNSSFIYGVTEVLPFPIAKVGPDFVAYENYLFELRHYIHYYQTQQQLDFNSDLGRQQLDDYKKRALNKVIDEAIVKQLAVKHNIKVTDAELDAQINIVRRENRLGANEKGFEDVLKDNFGWTVSDFKRSLRQQMLAQKVVAVLDTSTWDRAKAAQKELDQGKSFASVAKKYSDDSTTNKNGGVIGFAIDKTNRDIDPITIDALFSLKPGRYSKIINTGYSLEIVKNIQNQGSRVKAARIVFTFRDISTYLNDIKESQRSRIFIRL